MARADRGMIDSQLINAAAEAEERFGPDELERFAEQQRKRKMEEFQKAVLEKMAELRQRFADAGCSYAWIYFHATGYSLTKAGEFPFHFRFIVKHPDLDDQVEVKGVDLEEMVHETLRQVRFAQAQKQRLLTFQSA